jgi:hypothetical protein
VKKLLNRMSLGPDFKEKLFVVFEVSLHDADRVHCTLFRNDFQAVRDTLIDHLGGKNNPAELRDFWRGCRTVLPAWYEGAKLFALVCPSNAAAERAFSAWRTLIGDQQTTTLEDRQKVAIQSRYNTTI